MTLREFLEAHGIPAEEVLDHPMPMNDADRKVSYKTGVWITASLNAIAPGDDLGVLEVNLTLRSRKKAVEAGG
jgi:hypothetical protein